MLTALRNYTAKTQQTRSRVARGDTLIEVLFAVAVMSLVIVTSITLMNQGTNTSVRSLQSTLARQELDNQAETLRFLNSAYVAAYTSGTLVSSGSATPAQVYRSILDAVEAKGAKSVTTFGTNNGTSCSKAPTGSFILNTKTARFQSYDANKLVLATSYPQIVYKDDGTLSQSQGIWIEAVRSAASGGTRYTDFHIRACWGAPGMSVPMNLGTIVRLYDPAN